MKENLLNLSDNELITKFVNGYAWISIHGFGHVGAAIASAFLRKGCKVIAQDVKEEVIQKINSGKWRTIEDAEISKTIIQAYSDGKIVAMEGYEESVKRSSFHIITVPFSTKKLGKNCPADVSLIVDVSRNIGKFLEVGDAVSIETTLPPGTTENTLRPVIEEESGLKAGRDFALIYSPERILVGRALEDIESRYPKIVSGYGKMSLRIGQLLYSIVAQKGVIILSSIKAAEAEKVFEGVYRDVNIALANELADYCEEEGLDYWEIMNAANSQPYSHLHKPGIGVGGACIPVYPYFILKGRERLLKLVHTARKINERKPIEVAERAVIEFRRKYGDLKGCKVVVLGLSFRGGVADSRLSPTLDVVKRLLKYGCDVVVHDPFTYEENDLPREVVFTNDLSKALRGVNIVIVATDHSEYNGLTLEKIRKYSSDKLLVIDPKNILPKNKP
ncbi:MAG: nucleotide sugar dehydrogenase [Nitrososphaeria archaeon]